MVAIWTGQETIPQDVSYPIPLTVEEVNITTQEGWLSPEESQALYDETQRLRAEELEKQRLAEMQKTAQLAHAEYYAEGGAGYGTVPGGPDYVYMPSDAPLVAQTVFPILDPYYGEGGIFAPVTSLVSGEGGARENLLLYGAIAIGALALLKR
tara:strand:+ start:266 stop:724 length:459 start_codon:yes stop_codon:yes gene_type:complete